MPGPVSDSYDPEWGTSQNKGMLEYELNGMYDYISDLLEGKEPEYILNVIQKARVFNSYNNEISNRFTEYELRLIRFALERAIESV